MKESVTKFDLEAAFKALDEIDIPSAEKGIKANKPALTEIFSRKSKFDSLFEEYYDISDMGGLDDAKEAREAEIAKAKLDRIEKIVDLDAESPEDLLTSYVGKYIMQCPQCMTLFYKDPEDVVASEDDPDTVNINEICQHCGNESGYTLVGKVGEAEAEEPTPEENLDLSIPEEGEEVPAEDIPSEEGTEDLGDLGDLEELDLNLEDEEEQKEESFTSHSGEALVEELSDSDLDAKLEAHNEYIEYLRSALAQEEEALEKAKNEQVKAAIQRRIDAFKADLESALPDEVKDSIAAEEFAAEVTGEESTEVVPVNEEPVADEVPEIQEESLDSNIEDKVLTEALHEETDDLDVSAEEFEELIKSPEFKKPISDTDARAMMDAEKAEEAAVEESAEAVDAEEVLEEGILDKIKDKFVDVVDNITSKLKTREAKADWVLANAMEDYENVKVDTTGKLVPDESNQRFLTFLVIGYKEKDNKGKTILAAPKFNDKTLVVGMRRPEAKKDYESADNIAKGWSMRQGNGPAFIYLAKNAEGEDAVFLCEYFKGKLEYDQLAKYFDVVKKDLKAAKLMAKGGMNQSEDEESVDDDEMEGLPENLETKSELNAIMENLEELQEASLEKLISDSLVEAYGNVAGYKLTSCEYLNEKLNVNGTVYFTSGNTRKTTYVFTEAYIEEDKVKLCGLNEKLGLDKKFTLTGRIDNTNKTLITESFSNK